MANNKNAAKKSSINTVVNIIIAIAIIAVLVLAVIAVADKFKPDVHTVAEQAEELGMDVNDFISEYGLGDVKPTDDMDKLIDGLSLENYAKLNGTTFDEMKEQSMLPEEITAEMTVKEAREKLEAMTADEDAQEPEAEAEAPEAEENSESAE